MKSRKFSLIGISGVLALSFVVLVLIGHTQTSNPDLTNPQELIGKAFPNSKITWSKKLEGNMINYQATSTALAMNVGSREKSVIKFINFKDTTEWSIDCHERSCLYYDVIGEDDPKLWIGGLKDGRIQTRVINSKGEELIDTSLKSWLYPSPCAKYYYTRDNHDSYNHLKIHDSKGEFLWRRKTPGLKVWYVRSLSDSELIYIDYRGYFLLNALTAEEIWNIPPEQLNIDFPEISTASNGKHFILTGVHDMASIDNEGQVLWMKKTQRIILAATLSEDGRLVAIYTQEPKTKDGKRLELLDNFNDGEVLWSRLIESEFQDVRSEVHGLKIVGNSLLFVPGYLSYYLRGITAQMQTLYFEIDPANGKLFKWDIIDGVCETLITNTQKVHYLLVTTGGTKDMFRIEQVKKK